MPWPAHLALFPAGPRGVAGTGLTQGFRLAPTPPSQGCSGSAQVQISRHPDASPTLHIHLSTYLSISCPSLRERGHTTCLASGGLRPLGGGRGGGTARLAQAEAALGPRVPPDHTPGGG